MKPVPVKVSNACYLSRLHVTISDVDLGLVLHGPVQRCICESAKTSHI
jgi:hypothetical protein